jgi:CubicO group peptidase (beta-lactamase class C family)
MPQDPLPENIDVAKITSAVDTLFVESNPNKKLRTRALLIVHDGRIINERYGPGITKGTRLLGWFITKSVTNAILGILVRKGNLSLKEPAPVPEWQKKGDARRAITFDRLLRMSSGLEWVEAYAERPVPDVNIMLLLKPDTGSSNGQKCVWE